MMLNTLWQDVRYGLRMLAKSPGFTAVAIFTLALGIGANSALFSIVNGVLLNPLPYKRADHLVAVYSSYPGKFAQASISYPNFLDWVRDNQSFSSLSAFREDNFDMTDRGEPQRVRVEMVSANFFSTLGVKPILGRWFLSQEDQVGAPPVVMLSGGFWKGNFASSRSVIGEAIELNGTAYTIVGVVPANFGYWSGNFHAHTDVFVPLGQWSDPTFRDRRVGMGMDAVGRLKAGVTLAQAKAGMDAIAQHLAETYPDADKGEGITLIPLKQDVVGDIRPFLLVLLAAVGFVLLIACVNVANLLLARSTGRTREFAIRSALGADTGRMVRQLLTESVLLAVIGGSIGLLIAAWGTQAALKVLPEALPRAAEIHTDSRVLLFTLAASLFAGILFGLAPALKMSRSDVHETLKEGGRGGSGTRHRTQSIFVATEMALALVLLIGAGLMIRSLTRLWSVNPGFDPHHVLASGVSSPTPIGSTPEAIHEAMRDIHDAIAAVPGVAGVSVSVGALPMASDSEDGFWLEGQPRPASTTEMKFALFDAVQPDYLKVMKIPLLRGRFLTPQDNEHSPQVIVIDEDFARLAFGNQNSIGKRVNFDIIGTSPEIVGVVGHVKQWGLDENAKSPVLAQSYLPVTQVPDKFLSLMSRGFGLMVRTDGSPLTEVGAIRQALQHYNGQLVLHDTQTMDKIISDSLAARRFAMLLLGIFAGLAVVLSSVGIYGVISYVVGQRTHEIGIRMALGAAPQNVRRMVLSQGTKMTLIGVAFGLAGALVLTRLMAKMLFGVSAYDPLTFLGVAGLLVLVALAACYVPARKATRVDPMVALRYE